jgi:hypothetical protein
MTQIDRTPSLKWQGVPSKDPQKWIGFLGLVGDKKVGTVGEANFIGTK